MAKATKRENWSGQTGFLLAAIGSAVGLGNIWRFPGVAYENGGGAFLIPYLVALLTAGIPILFLDYALGHRYQGSAPTVFRRLFRGGESLGWFQVAISFVIMCYYGVILAWAASFTYFSINEAWGEDPTAFFTGTYLELAEQPGLSLDVVGHLLLPLLVVWLAVLFVMVLGVQNGLEKANVIFLPLLVILFAILVVRALFLDGAMEGLNALFTPDFSQLTNTDVWLAAYSQIFFSLSIAFGIMITYSSYLRRRSDLTTTGLVAGFANSSFEILAGIGVFATLGFMATASGVGVQDLEGITGPILSFVTFPQIISMMPGGPIFGVLFFGSLVLAGFTSMISIAQVVVAALQEKFELARAAAAALVVGVCGTISILLFATTTGLYTLDTVDKYINEIGIITSAIVMTLVVSWRLRKLPELQAHLNRVSAFQVGAWWRVLLSVVVPVMLLVMVGTTGLSLITDGYEGYPTWYLNLMGWGVVGFAIVFAIVFTLIPGRRGREDHTTFDPESLRDEDDLEEVR
ncbi:sodium-dependent transporter [Ornithinimicrobium cavernae]|uniref:sodium-dependent transporter n=1 Tax=Ornithinimicrobium cavernae TaxID=2666047 RepID=UPI000D69CBC0|nr:sodium-dependent transporter [Ornithinimicrobium cavernae]